MKNIVGVLLWGWLFSTVAMVSADEIKNPFAGDADAIAEGQMLFEAVCSGYCHVKAEAERDGKCPNLFDCDWVNGTGTDEEMFQVVSDGVPKTEMVGFAGQLPDDMIWQILAYVRNASKCESQGGPVTKGQRREVIASAHE